MNEKGYYSGGGFSNTFPRPPWQDAAVQTYLDDHAPHYGDDVFNCRGRGYPDVSALGLNQAVVYDGYLFGIPGTSAAAPIFASIVSQTDGWKGSPRLNTLCGALYLYRTLYTL